jgi:hypothetical protein
MAEESSTRKTKRTKTQAESKTDQSARRDIQDENEDPNPDDGDARDNSDIGKRERKGRKKGTNEGAVTPRKSASRKKKGRLAQLTEFPLDVLLEVRVLSIIRLPILTRRACRSFQP